MDHYISHFGIYDSKLIPLGSQFHILYDKLLNQINNDQIHLCWKELVAALIPDARWQVRGSLGEKKPELIPLTMNTGVIQIQSWFPFIMRQWGGTYPV